MKTGKQLQIANCNSCHESPPTTGFHDFHLFKQQNAAPLSCIECHGSALSTMNWVHQAKREVFNKSASVSQVKNDTAIITSPRFDTLSYNLCMTQLQGSTLYGATMDSFKQLVTRFSTTDSVFSDGQFIWHLPYTGKDTLKTDSTVIQIAPGVFITTYDTTLVKIYGTANSYDLCAYQLKGLDLYKSVVLSFDRMIQSFTNNFSMLEQKEFNRRYIFEEKNESDTARFVLKPLEQTAIARLPQSQWIQWVSSINATSNMILAKEDSLRDSLFQLKDKTLYLVAIDSIVDYENSIFAVNTALHNNGNIDIFFSLETTTVYRKDTLEILAVDSITGEILSGRFKEVGAWRPERLSCMSSGIQTAKCHERIVGSKPETFWYNPEEL